MRLMCSTLGLEWKAALAAVSTSVVRKSRRRRLPLRESVYDESPIVLAGERCDDGTRWTTMGRILTLRSESAGQPIANACALGFRTKTWLKIHNAEIADR